MVKMPQDFPIWYASLEAGQGSAAVTRWAGVADVIHNLQAQEIEALIRLALKSRQGPDESVKARIVENINRGDPTFGTVAAERELQILAAAALTVRLLPSDTAALALTTAGLDGARKPQLPMDLIAMAENAVREKSKTTRARVDVKAITVDAIEWPAAEDDGTDPDPLVALKALKAAADKALHGTIERASGIVSQLARRQELVDEELQMLWWLMSGELTDGSPQADLKLNERSLVVAEELARRTARRPGPMSIPALLSRSGLNRKTKINITDAVNAMSDAWCKAILSGTNISAVTHPIHEALRRRDETGQGPNWISGWAAVCEIPEDHALSSLRLAELFYRERLLLKTPA
ncbi:GTPase-associated system all-helical protein GASH [Phenylobacterium montanum]|uniref:Uncharacterized protein n=1 Tax=Phenylobacterium montanum TaxID=2823693 RepID=A0A975G3R4_9CAUL|nr:GTPase-associated system all-helical protein GASH [Caulobacter sp. S6]QUD90590.1 hypothetical protein KCG34_12320 [Caulobacter sp. S6]